MPNLGRPRHLQIPFAQSTVEANGAVSERFSEKLVNMMAFRPGRPGDQTYVQGRKSYVVQAAPGVAAPRWKVPNKSGSILRLYPFTPRGSGRTEGVLLAITRRAVFALLEGKEPIELGKLGKTIQQAYVASDGQTVLITGGGSGWILRPVDLQSSPQTFADGEWELQRLTQEEAPGLAATERFGPVSFFQSRYLCVLEGSDRFYYSEPFGFFNPAAGAARGELFPFFRFSAAVADPDQLLLAINNERNLYLMGNEVTEAWGIASGDTPFAKLNGGGFRRGVAGPDAAAVLGEYVYWLDQDACLWRVQDWEPVLVSDPAQSSRIRELCDNDLRKVRMTARSFNSFHFVTLHTPKGAFCLEAQSGHWHELQDYRDLEDEEGTEWPVRDTAHAYGRTWAATGKAVGEYKMGEYQWEHDDNGSPIPFVRRATTLPLEQYPEESRIFALYVWASAETKEGVGDAEPLNVRVKQSVNGGPWSNMPDEQSGGLLTDQAGRLTWRQLGNALFRTLDFRVQHALRAFTIFSAYLSTGVARLPQDNAVEGPQTGGMVRRRAR